MLYSLSVKNFAIIEDLHIEFNDGMTVLTGETGAGKSLIIDSIGLLLGDRADSDMVRYGSDKAYIEGAFDYKSSKIDDILSRLGIEKKDRLTIYREISLNGRNQIKVNGSSISLVELKNIKEYLADIHVQHDTFRLINPDTYLSFVDAYAGENVVSLYNNYQLAYDKYLSKLRELKSLEHKVELSRERLEFLIYERDEIEALELYENKDAEIEEKISKLRNFDKIYKSLNEAYQALDGEASAIDSIYNAYKFMDDISEYDAFYKEASDTIYDAYSNIDDIKSKIYKSINMLDYDEDELNALEDEIKKIDDCKAKYKKSVSELIEELEKIKLEINMSENYESVKLEYEEMVKKAHASLVEHAKALSDLRRKKALELSKMLVSECVDLELFDTRFEIEFNTPNVSDPFDASPFLENGYDEVSFMVSLNKGEPLKMLQKVASGGELSRIMLAFKAIFAKTSALSLMVFDEIDTGVSGSAAYQIALKMKKISEYTQVLCITHLPRVAAIADTQMYISKSVENGRTTTAIKTLDYDERVEKLATMIGGSTISKLFIDAAKEMLGKK